MKAERTQVQDTRVWEIDRNDRGRSSRDCSRSFHSVAIAIERVELGRGERNFLWNKFHFVWFYLCPTEKKW